MTGLEKDNYNNIAKIAKALERIANILEYKANIPEIKHGDIC